MPVAGTEVYDLFTRIIVNDLTICEHTDRFKEDRFDLRGFFNLVFRVFVEYQFQSI